MQTEVIKEDDEAYGHQDALGAMFSMTSNGEAGEGEVNVSQALTRDFCERIASTSSGFLVAHAAEVVLFTRMTSIRKVAQYFSERFGKKISEMPIRDILHKVKTHKIAVTEEQIARLGDAHPIARKFLDSVPWASDPAVAVQPVIQEAPKRRGRPKKVQEAPAPTKGASQDTQAKPHAPTSPFGEFGGLVGSGGSKIPVVDVGEEPVVNDLTHLLDAESREAWKRHKKANGI
jgi:hypothetical protein